MNTLTPRARWTLVSLAVLFAMSPALSGRLMPNRYAGGRSRNVEARQERNSSSVGLMLGEFRTSMSDILLLKTERYLHSGIGYTPHVNKQLLSTTAKTEAYDEHQNESCGTHEGCSGNHDEAGGSTTLIKPPSKDYRGLIGHLHREVKPWRDPSEHEAHTDGTQVLPWFRVMTMSDPHYVRGYTLGGYWLNRFAPEEAVPFLIEGIKNNPDAFQVHLMLGQAYLAQARKKVDDLSNPTEDERALLLQARDAYRQAADSAMAQRPPLREGDDYPDTWSVSLEDDALAAARMAVLLEKRYGDPITASALAERYLETVPEDAVLARHTGR